MSANTVVLAVAACVAGCGSTQTDATELAAPIAARVNAVVRTEVVVSTNAGFGGDDWLISLEPKQRFERPVRQIKASTLTSATSQQVASLVHELGTAPPDGVVVVDGTYTKALVDAFSAAGWRVVIATRFTALDNAPMLSLADHRRYIPRLLGSLAALRRTAERCARKAHSATGRPWVSFVVDERGRLSQFRLGSPELGSPASNAAFDVCMGLAVRTLSVAPAPVAEKIVVRLVPAG